MSTFQVTPINKCFVLGGDETYIQFNYTINYRSVLETATNWLKEIPGAVNTPVSSNNISSRFPEKYDIEREYNLVIRNVEISDALHYSCENSLGGTAKIQAFAYLIVLGKL